MSAVRIVLPDNTVKEFNQAPTILDVAQSIGSRLAKDTVGGLVNGEKEVSDLRRRLQDQDRLKIVTLQMPESLEVVRHSAAHVMAQAVQELWPEVKVTIGPVIDGGFYYDFDSPHHFTPEMLAQVDQKIKEILERNSEVRCEELVASEAIETFRKMGEKYKVELIQDLGAEKVTIYHQGNWFDLCRGPHVQRLGQIKAVKCLSVAGSYWRGDENRERLQRIYATAFNSKKDLDEHLQRLEEAKKRDHRKLGKELGLFAFHPLSPGGPFFTPKGTIIYNELVQYIREKYRQFDFHEVITPQIFDVDLYHQSGHYENYRENMYFTQIDHRDFSVKPMNCPGHCLLYGVERKSYRDLPFRVADFGRLHRYERSGVMHGLTRVRTFCQDDAHIFCDLKDLHQEISLFMKFLGEVYQQLGLHDYRIYLSTRPEKRMGSEQVWDQAEGALREALTSLHLPFEENPGDGAFYGPKLDIMFVDALKRPWQLGTLQCDFNMPEAFDLKYVGDDNSEHRPVMLHRAILGSLERFIGLYLEHTAGHLPLWLAPVQVVVLNVTDRQLSYCREIMETLKGSGLRAHLDSRGEKLGFKIREAQMQKIPYMLIVGDKELESGQVSLRLKDGGIRNNLSMTELIESFSEEIKNRLVTSPWLVESSSPIKDEAQV